VTFSDGETLLDVTLERNGQIQRWTIQSHHHLWSCRFISPGRVMHQGCRAIDAAKALKAEWEADIEAAKADGWV